MSSVAQTADDSGGGTAAPADDVEAKMQAMRNEFGRDTGGGQERRGDDGVGAQHGRSTAELEAYLDEEPEKMMRMNCGECCLPLRWPRARRRLCGATGRWASGFRM